MSSESCNLTTVDSTGIVLASEFVSFMDALNPLGNLAKVVAKVVACRVDIKRLQNEANEAKRAYELKAKQSKYDYEITSKKIDATLAIALESLDNRRFAMEQFFSHAEKEMRQHHIYGNQIVRTLQNMRELAFRRDVPFEEKKLAYEAIQSLSKDLVASQNNGTTTLGILVQNTRQDLSAVAGILPSS
ncbi:hypothetical protein D0962_37560 [Leptolyngbyaceae cyanobacterium CCMR0082]|uniref:Uncharacterized protein n=1 Tax=Adonisia turfae CCMR0082 TaxID=2304604 RepID=A0A6M0SIG0_9CYAN|nr:hypothetical protein [Adonisia turfae]NEZ68370.1 hypothetical protein [Adonisia turfae CCMR0082]